MSLFVLLAAVLLVTLPSNSLAKSPDKFPSPEEIAQRRQAPDAGLSAAAKAMLGNALREEWLDNDFEANAVTLKKWRGHDKAVAHEVKREKHSLKLLAWHDEKHGDELQLEIQGTPKGPAEKGQLIALAKEFFAVPDDQFLIPAKVRKGDEVSTQLFWRAQNNTFIALRQDEEGNGLVARIHVREDAGPEPKLNPRLERGRGGNIQSPKDREQLGGE